MEPVITLLKFWPVIISFGTFFVWLVSLEFRLKALTKTSADLQRLLDENNKTLHSMNERLIRIETLLSRDYKERN